MKYRAVTEEVERHRQYLKQLNDKTSVKDGAENSMETLNRTERYYIKQELACDIEQRNGEKSKEDIR